MNIRQIKDTDYKYFSDNVRELDARECEAVSRRSPLEQLKVGIESSIEHSVLADKDDNPIAFGGILKQGDITCIWLLTTNLVETNKKTFMKYTKSEVKRCFEKYGILWIATDLRYEQALKLNEWCGFKRHDSNVFINNFEFAIYKYDGE